MSRRDDVARGGRVRNVRLRESSARPLATRPNCTAGKRIALRLWPFRVRSPMAIGTMRLVEGNHRLVHVPQKLPLRGFQAKTIAVDCRQTSAPSMKRALPTGTGEVVSMTRRGMRRVAMVLVVAAAVTACSKTKTNVQTPPSATSSATTSAVPTSQTPTSSVPIKPIPTPTVTPSAQGAVDAYIAFYNATAIADRDPAHADLSFIDEYLTGTAKSTVESTYAEMKRQRLASRGTPGDPRVRVSSVLSPVAVMLTSCLTVDREDPYTEYHVDTGSPVAIPTRTPPPPYQLMLTMKLVDGRWKLADVLQDTSKTCSG